jgi:NTP pyrophosphatase (non-canonical NTP hydrolase)
MTTEDKFTFTNEPLGNELDDYQRLASRTISGESRPQREQELCCALGVAGEAGEVADLIKKEFFHGHTPDREKLKKELGDVLWYIAMLARARGLTLSEVADANIAKLRARYPDGFSKEKSRNRSEP